MNTDSLLFQALIYLAAAVVFVPIAKRAGLGSVLGYLIAGVVIGPAVLGWVGHEGKDVMHFAEFGVVMMLFLIGLELEPERLWKLRVPILGLGGLQVLMSIAGGALLSLLAGFHWKEGLAIGMVLSLSSTAIVLQILQEKGWMKSDGGQSTFSVLLFQDIAVIPMLSLMPLLSSHPVEAVAGGHESVGILDGLPGWMQSLSLLLSVVLVIIVGRYLIRPVLRWIASTRQRELFTATALLMVVGIAALMTIVGLSPALGTFLAGVVLANSEYRHELESDIEPFKGLLLGLFFISVGAGIDFQLFVSKPLVIIGIVLSIMLLKAMILGVLGNIFQLKGEQNWLFALGLCQLGEFGFVLFSFIQKEGVLQVPVIQLLVAAIALSMALTPLVMMVYEKFILPKYVQTKEDKEADIVEEKNPVIIAGFDKFGNIVGRFLKANGVGTTVLDNDADRVELLRKLGLKVYYGDATRHDLLHAAGAEDAKILIIALDEPEKIVHLAATARKHYPHLKIFSRAIDRGDAYELFDEGVQNVYRETLDTSLRMGVDVLKTLGFRTYNVQRLSRTFLKHDEKALIKLAELRKDKMAYINSARDNIQELEQMMLADKADRPLEIDTGWDAETLIQEFGNRTENITTGANKL